MSTNLLPPNLFKSFWLGGFESSCHINKAGLRLDMLRASQHDTMVANDYALLRNVGIGTARDAVRWPLVERSPGTYDFSSLIPFIEAAQANNMQIIWDICHYGWPDDLDIFSPAFVDRFAGLCQAVAKLMKQYSDEIPFYTPMNEISFFAWAAGEVAWFYPYAQGRGVDLKQQLVRATIAGCEAIWDVDPRARIVHVDPIMHVVAPRDKPELAQAAWDQRSSQFEAWDMLAGMRDPHLGGHPRYLDIIGTNFYHSNQWEYQGERLRWEEKPRDDRWLPLNKILAEVYHRYGRPLFIGETGHVGIGRAEWITEIAAEIIEARRNAIPIEGVCLYPIIDRYDWENPNHWHNCGLWDFVLDEKGQYQRTICVDYANALAEAQNALEAHGCPYMKPDVIRKRAAAG